MKKSTRVSQAVVAAVTVLAVGATGVYAASHGNPVGSSSDELSTGHPEQVLIAQPGGHWEQRGADGISSHLESWSRGSMMPGERSSRSYVIRNMDARAGTWRVSVGEPELSDNTFLAVGSEATSLGLTDPDVAPEAAPEIPEQPDTWLVGPGTAELEGLQSTAPGSLLAEVSIGSCEAAAITDWVEFPDVTDHYYMDASTRPKLHATFIPATGEPDEFVDGNCDSASVPPTSAVTPPPTTAVPPPTSEVTPPPSSTAAPGSSLGSSDSSGSSERCHSAVTSVAAMLGTLALFGVLAAVALPVLWRMISYIDREVQALRAQVPEPLSTWEAEVDRVVQRLSESWFIPAAFGLGVTALAVAACAPPGSSTSSAGTR